MTTLAEDDTNLSASGRIHHVVLIGFHHKKGCIIEYCYPPLQQDDGSVSDPSSLYLPSKWQALPSLAMPDGAHNFSEDVVYFHLPPIKTDTSDDSKSDETIYCVSYCRQVDTNQLSQKDEQVTRGTVQKSVVVLSKVPAFGLIHTKLQLPLVENAFLENFSNKAVLVELYDQLATSLRISDESHYFFGLECRDLVLHFRRKLLSLFKLLLLERRVIFHTTRASILVNTILSLLSLYPRMIERGLSHATELDLILKPERNSNDEISSHTSKISSDSSGENSGNSELPNLSAEEVEKEDASLPPTTGQSITRFSPIHKMAEKLSQFGRSTPTKQKNGESANAFEEQEKLHILEEDDNEYVLTLENARLEMTVGSPERISKPDNTIDRNAEYEILYEDLQPSPLHTDDTGHPLNLFTNGHVCLPYVSLQQHDLIKDNSHRGFLAGATNILFVTQRDLCDAVVDISTGVVTYHDPKLERLLSLSPADLRFTEHIMSNTLPENETYISRAAEWKGGDEWLRGMFTDYLKKMLCVAANKSSDSKQLSDFNDSFISEWKKTKNFRTWCGKYSDKVSDPSSQHPFHGQFSMSDVRLRLHHKLQDSEQGRKLEDALSNANDTLVNTGRYVGNAIGSAKSWFSSKLQSRRNSQPES